MIPHPIFEREATDIFCNVPISIVDASLGGSVDVPTVSGGKVKVKIPAGSQNGDQFRLNSKGMPTIRSTSFGDMIISLSVEVPKDLSENKKKLLRELLKFTRKRGPIVGLLMMQKNFLAKVTTQKNLKNLMIL